MLLVSSINVFSAVFNPVGETPPPILLKFKSKLPTYFLSSNSIMVSVKFSLQPEDDLALKG